MNRIKDPFVPEPIERLFDSQKKNRLLRIYCSGIELGMSYCNVGYVFEVFLKFKTNSSSIRNRSTRTVDSGAIKRLD